MVLLIFYKKKNSFRWKSGIGPSSIRSFINDEHASINREPDTRLVKTAPLRAFTTHVRNATAERRQGKNSPPPRRLLSIRGY